MKTLTIVLLLLVVFVSCEFEDANVTQTQPTIKRDVNKFVEEYYDNSIAAENRYRGERVDIVGVIDGFGVELMGRPYIIFKRDNYRHPYVQAVFLTSDKSTLERLRKGQTIRAWCTVGSHMFGSVGLRNCRYISTVR